MHNACLAGVAEMMGRQAGGQERLFYSFNLESVVPENHLLRGINRCLDLRELREHLADYYSPIGRPSVDPELMIRMRIIGYCYGIRSERRLCEEVHLNLAYRWFCRLGLDGEVPDHSTFCKNRHGRFRGSDLVRSGVCARRCTSIWPTGGSAGSGSTAKSPTTPPSARTGMAASVGAISFAAASVRGGAPQSGLQVVLPARARRRSPRPLHLLQEQAWPLPWERSLSQRRLCEEVHLNLAYRWFCRLGLDGEVPDHSTFCKNRHGRFRGSDLFRRVFETVLRRCIRERLVGGEGFAVDASLIKADANRQKGVEGNKG